MAISRREVAMTTMAAHEIMETLGLESFVFSVEPSADRWELHLQCTSCGDVVETRFEIDANLLQASLQDEHLRQEIADDWRWRLRMCEREARLSQAHSDQPASP